MLVLRFIICIVLLFCLSVANASIFDTLKKFLQEMRSSDENGKEEKEKDTVAYPQLSKKQYTTLRSDSLLLLKEGKAKDALNPLMTILESDPNDEESNMLVGTTLLNELKRPDLAESFLYKAVSTSKFRNLIAISNLSLSLIKNNDIELASKVAMEGLRVNSDNKGQYDEMTTQDVLGQIMGLINTEKKDYVLAAEWYFTAASSGSKRSKVEDTNANNENVWLKASTLQFPPEQFNPMIAKSTLLEAIKFHPTNAKLVYNLGLAHHYNNEIDLAIQFYQSALELDKEFNKSTIIKEAWGTLGTALFAQNKLQQAHDAFEQAYTMTPNNHVMLSNWAKLLCAVGHHNEGRLLVDRALKIDSISKDVLEAKNQCEVQVQVQA